MNRIIAGILVTLLSATTVRANEVLSLSSYDGQRWELFSSAIASGLDLMTAKPSFQPSEWIEGIVPGTVFAAYVAAGKEDDPNYWDNIYHVDESKYNVHHWYRTTFDRPQQSQGHRTILTFEGINRYADVYFNGKRLGTISGHVRKMSFDVTDRLQDTDNLVAVKIRMMKDNFLPRTSNFVNYCCPTYVASHSWDWMPYVPGLNTGITNDVYLEFTGDVTACDPWVRTTLKDNYTRAEIRPLVSLKNLTAEECTVDVKATIMPGGQQVVKTVTVAAGDSVAVDMESVDVDNPRLWWPNGYGDANLYSCHYEVTENGQVIDSRQQVFGIREYKYAKENTAFVVYVNGKKVYCKGGNWGMSEYMLRTHGEEYDLRVRLHKDMHFNMIRCWTGCVTDEEFYDACDKYGIMVWDDFWLTGPYVGLTGPDDKKEFLANAFDKVVRLRNHPCEAVWCGDNEGWPYDELNDALHNIILRYDGGDRVYMPNSHNGYYKASQFDARDGSGWGLSGSGWWKSFWPEDYFDDGIWGGGGDKGDCVDWGFRSELGTGAFDTYESMKEFTPEDKMWPRNDMWEKHFFSNNAAYGGAADASDYYNKVETNYGKCSSAEEFCERAQLLNIEVSKALFEGWNQHLWDTATGILYWMSQPAYPSHLWQTYDYYFDMTGIYWGAKKACEPVHIQWNVHNNDVSIVNTTHEDLSGLRVEVEVFRMNGQRYDAASGSYSGATVAQNSVRKVTNMNTPDDGHSGKLSGITSTMFFLRLSLYDADGQKHSENFYWHNRDLKSHTYTSLNTIADAGATCEVMSAETDEEGWRHMKVRLHNPASSVAFALRLRLVDDEGHRILPVIMDDNYITLMPGEERELEMSYRDSQTNGDTHILLKQYNHEEREAAVSTDIAEVKAYGTSNRWYNLAGQTVSSDYRGVMIKNGRKIINK